jgi:hypothetical protein
LNNQKCDVEKARYWQSTIGEAARSGTSIREFSRQRWLKEGQFYWWQHELKGDRQERMHKLGDHPGAASFALVSEEPRATKELLTRPVGRPSQKPLVRYKSFLYQAASWKTARRVVAKVEFHSGELFPRVGFIVTNLEANSRAVVRFYNKRGTAGQ